MKAIIPTGGRGTRMQPLTFSTNKHFIPVGNKPLIFYPVESVVAAGIKDILITYNPGWLDVVKNYLGTGRKWGVKFSYVLQEKPLGLANIAQVCESELKGSSFVLHLGDNIFADGIKDLVDFFEKKQPNGLVAMVKHLENWRLGVPYFDKKRKLQKIVEKPKNPPHQYAMPGIYFADSHFFEMFHGKDRLKASKRGEYEMPDAFTWMIKNKYDVLVKEYEGKWLDPGKFGDWIDSNRYLLDTNLEENIQVDLGGNVKTQGRISIRRKTKISNSEIRGPVSIGEGVKIVNSYIGPYTSIDDNCVIENAHIENSVLMKSVSIKNVKQPINESLIGTEAVIEDTNGPTNWLKLFVGEKSQVHI